MNLEQIALVGTFALLALAMSLALWEKYRSTQSPVRRRGHG